MINIFHGGGSMLLKFVMRNKVTSLYKPKDTKQKQKIRKEKKRKEKRLSRDCRFSFLFGSN